MNLLQCIYWRIPMKQLNMKKISTHNFKQMMKNYKQWVPNVLTGSRIVLTPIIIILGMMKQIPLVIVLAGLSAITDCIDGKLARKWNTVSEIGAKLDAVADKIFAIGLCLCLTSIFSTLWIIVGLELILAICNLIFHYKSKKTQSLWIGKLKTTVLFITILFVICYHFFPNLIFMIQGLIYVCINLQVLCILEYSFNFYDNMHPISVEDNLMHQQIMEEKTIEIEHLEEFLTQYEKEMENNTE